MKDKIEEEFKVRFNAKNFKIMNIFEAKDAVKKCYVDEKTIRYLAEHFHCLGIDQSFLKLEMARTKKDLLLRLSISEKRCQNLLK